MTELEKQRHKAAAATWAKFAAVLIVIAGGMWAATAVIGNETAREAVASYGYPGAFLIAVISGFNLVVPIPAVAFMPVFIAAGLDFWTTIFIITVGVTIADTIAFLLGRTGRHVLKEKESAMLRRLERIRGKGRIAPLVVMFVYACAAPFPNELLAIPLGLMGYRTREIVPPLLAGNLLFNSLSATGLLTVFGVI